MKKQIITLAIILGMAMTGFAQGGGSMFHRENSGDNGTSLYKGMNREDTENPITMPGLPSHGSTDSQNAPLGSGIAMLFGLGAAYAVAKKRNEE